MSLTSAGLTGLGGVNPEAQFGELKVLRTGLRGGQTEKRPGGYPAAECECSCGVTVIIPCYRLINGNNKTCGHGACWKPKGNTIEDRIEAWIRKREATGARMAEIRDRFGLTNGSTGAHLHFLVRDRRLARQGRGLYVAPEWRRV